MGGRARGKSGGATELPTDKSQEGHRELERNQKLKPKRPVVEEKTARPALAGWRGWLELRPVQWKVVGLIPGQGTLLGCGFDSHWMCMGGHQSKLLSHFSVSLSPRSLPLSLKSINISSTEDLKNV